MMSYLLSQSNSYAWLSLTMRLMTYAMIHCDVSHPFLIKDFLPCRVAKCEDGLTIGVAGHMQLLSSMQVKSLSTQSSHSDRRLNHTGTYIYVLHVLFLCKPGIKDEDLSSGLLNLHLWVVCNDRMSILLHFMHYPFFPNLELRQADTWVITSKKKEGGGDAGCAAACPGFETRHALQVSEQPISAFAWNQEKQGLFCCTALDQTVRVGLVTKLHLLWTSCRCVDQMCSKLRVEDECKKTDKQWWCILFLSVGFLIENFTSFAKVFVILNIITKLRHDCIMLESYCLA